jgi:hypothetical protein
MGNLMVIFWNKTSLIIRRRIIIWVIVSATLWSIKLTFGIGFLLLRLIGLITIGQFTGSIKGSEWAKPQLVSNLRGLIVIPILITLAPELFALSKELLIERSVETLIQLIAFIAISFTIASAVDQAIRNSVRR